MSRESNGRESDGFLDFLKGAAEAALATIVVAAIGVVLGTDLESSPWFWAFLAVSGLIFAAAAVLRRRG